MSGSTQKNCIVYQFVPLVFCAVFGVGLIFLAYSFALPTFSG